MSYLPTHSRFGKVWYLCRQLAWSQFMCKKIQLGKIHYECFQICALSIVEIRLFLKRANGKIVHALIIFRYIATWLLIAIVQTAIFIGKWTWLLSWSICNKNKTSTVYICVHTFSVAKWNSSYCEWPPTSRPKQSNCSKERGEERIKIVPRSLCLQIKNPGRNQINQVIIIS